MPPSLTATIATIFEAELRSRLTQRGLAEVSTGHFRYEVAPGVYGDLAVRVHVDEDAGEVGVWPIVGVRIQRLEALIDELNGREVQEDGNDTIGKPVAYLMDHFDLADWSFRSEAEVADQVHRVLAAFEDYGVPFISAHASLTDAVAQMSPSDLGGGHHGERLAAAYFLLGDTEKACEVLAHQLRRLEQGEYPGLEESRQFATRLRARVARASG
jgi:hypothetical protein